MVSMGNVKSRLFSIKNAALILIGINIVMFVLQQIVSGLTDNLMLISGDVLVRPWILLTSMFLHGSGAHLVFNMYALLLFGTLIEQRIGTKRFLSIYFISGILAGIGFAVFQELILHSSGAAIGASGAVMGILGMTIMLLPDMRVLLFFVIPMSMRTAGIIFALVDLLGVFGIGIKGIANIAHLVGLACGVAYGFYLIRQKRGFAGRFVEKPRHHMSHHTTRHSAGINDRNKSIELSKEDIDDYLKYGRL